MLTVHSPRHVGVHFRSPVLEPLCAQPVIQLGKSVPYGQLTVHSPRHSWVHESGVAHVSGGRGGRGARDEGNPVVLRPGVEAAWVKETEAEA